MKFNIIYTPGSLIYLDFFVWSLLEYSEHTFQLVSNGCDIEEVNKLERMASRSDRLQFFRFPTPKMLPHGTVLNLLQQVNKDSYFCFLDSDIFASAALPNFKDLIDTNDLAGLFSGMPIWVSEENRVTKSDYNMLFGTNNTIEGSGSIGNSYFAMYRNYDLSLIRTKYGVTFGKIFWEQLPAEIRAILEASNLKRNMYDTGKIINALMVAENMKLENIDVDALCHLGGFSIAVNIKKKSATQSGKSVLASLRSLCHQGEYELKQKMKEQLKQPIRQYFFQLHDAVVNDLPIPDPPDLSNKEIKNKLSKAKTDYIELYLKYGNAR